jgi:hypothetical protein
MKALLRYADKFALAGAMLLFLAAAWWAWMSFHKIDAIAALNPSIMTRAAAYESQTIEMPAITQVSWPDPPNQSRGPEWVYDTFTPPVIYYDPRNGEFTVTRPELNIVTDEPLEVPFDVELVSVRQEPYRIQLVGYAGDGSDYIAHLEVAELGTIVLGRPGVSYPAEKGDFTLRSLDVRRVTTNTGDSMPVVETVGFAVILDGRTGREVTLTTRERLMLPRLQCVLRTRVQPVEEHILREGMKVTVNGHDYVVVQLSLHPSQAVVSRRPPNSIGGAETRTLTPVGGAATSGPGGTGFATHNSIDSPLISLFPNLRHLP